ncbi:MAG: hypothetical protein K6E96_09705 [Bacteroidales bacterium]|nr:hypothetical protein [Bacteroidales bacterium]
MKNKIILFVSMFLGGSVYAQSALLAYPTMSSELFIESGGAYSSNLTKSTLSFSKGNSSYTRGSGFFIRPELDREISIKAGYQINPFVQVYGGAGFDPWLGGFGGSLGARAYTNDGKWSAFFDLRLGGLSIGAVSSSLIAGAAYKDFDFGAGFTYYTDGYTYILAPTILVIGYNIRCYDHR